ncbi:MAG: phage terminase large subunit [Pyrinomonadaceae bacterium]|nr:phage terminase large subunit [Pyrinomonadaceae bacterium]
MTRCSQHAFQNWLTKNAKPFKWDWPHQLFLYKALHRVTTGECKRLIITMPPRHGKSETVTIRYAAWRLERDPKLNIILGSYNQKLANRFSRRIRAIVEERIPLAKDKRSADEWETQARGGVKAVGVGAGITGFGGSLVIIDDPVKNRAQAESRTMRDNVWDWFNDDIYTRLEPGASIILIQTRWHEDDLAGRLLKQSSNGGEVWEKVDLPALAEDGDPLGREIGEALWPERYSSQDLEAIRRQQGTYSFSALYQQQPVPSDGGLFNREWFQHIVSRPPNGLAWARGYDLAVSTKTTSDHTASFRCAFDRNGNLYIADGFRRRIEYPEQRRYVIDRVGEERNTSHGIEKALHGQALVQDLRQDVKVRGRPIEAIRVDADKITRALAWAGLAEDGKVILVQGTWIDDFVDEVCSFPYGSHDDQVDAVSLAVRMLSRRKRAMHRFD